MGTVIQFQPRLPKRKNLLLSQMELERRKDSVITGMSDEALIATFHAYREAEDDAPGRIRATVEIELSRRDLWDRATEKGPSPR